MFFHEGPLIDLMWCCAMSAVILGPILFLTLYIDTDISRILWLHLLINCPIRRNLSILFQQGSALTHTADNSLRYLYTDFDKRIISGGMCVSSFVILNL
jgi:hypothetical protein